MSELPYKLPLKTEYAGLGAVEIKDADGKVVLKYGQLSEIVALKALVTAANLVDRLQFSYREMRAGRIARWVFADIAESKMEELLREADQSAKGSAEKEASILHSPKGAGGLKKGE